MPESTSTHDVTDARISKTSGRRVLRVTPQVSILWRVFTVNAVVFGAAALTLIVSPATVHNPVRATELDILLAGLAVTLMLDLALLTFVLSPVRKLARLMANIDPLRPGKRAEVGPWASSEAASLARALNNMLDRLESERRESARRALAAQEAERARVARDLHDEVGQALTAIALRAERATGDRTLNSHALEEIVDVAHVSLADIRRIARELRPEALDDLGLTGALIALCLRVEQQSSMRVARELGSGLPELETEVELVIYRVAQEALTNAVRHSDATEVKVALVSTPTGVKLTVSDDGCGMDGEQIAEGAGLAGMRERALLVDAKLEIDSSPANGFTVTLEAGPR